jgi:site-specific recombinase XerD
MHVVGIARHYGSDPADMTERQVADFLLFLRTEQKCAPASMALKIVALRTFYREHLGREWALWNTVRVRRVESLPTVLSREEVAAVIQVAKYRRFRVLFTLIYHCGLRLGEAVRIAPRDIDAKAGRLHIRHAKGGKERYVPVTAAMVEQLREFYRLHRNPQWLFPGLGCGWMREAGSAEEAARKSDHHMTERTVQMAFHRCVAQSGIAKKAVVHTLRHSYATHLLEEGISVRIISQFLGHASLNTTVIYTHLTIVSEEKTRAALDRLHFQLQSKR